MFDAIVLANGWDDATAALPSGRDALNVALLVHVSRRTSRTGLVDALSAHYGSPGRLAYNRQSYSPVLLIFPISVPIVVTIGRHLTSFLTCAKFNM